VPVAVRGLRQLSAAFSKADRDVRLGWRHGLRDIAEPVRRDAEQLAVQEISHIGRRWWRMRTGVTRRVVYVAPRQRGIKATGDRRRARPNLADLLMDKAMEPSLHAHEPEIENAVDRLLDRMANDFNRGGSL
jgi:hypothetical protein